MACGRPGVEVGARVHVGVGVRRWGRSRSPVEDWSPMNGWSAVCNSWLPVGPSAISEYRSCPRLRIHAAGSGHDRFKGPWDQRAQEAKTAHIGSVNVVRTVLV